MRTRAGSSSSSTGVCQQMEMGIERENAANIRREEKREQAKAHDTTEIIIWKRISRANLDDFYATETYIYWESASLFIHRICWKRTHTHTNANIPTIRRTFTFRSNDFMCACVSIFFLLFYC